jgi:hypothetical protein
MNPNKLMEKHPKMKKRLMFGSDWFMHDSRCSFPLIFRRVQQKNIKPGCRL